MFTKTHFYSLRDEIYKKSGISIDEKKYETIAPKIVELVRKHQFETMREFFHHIKFDKRKVVWQDILNLVTINETYFFRESYQIESLIADILPKLHHKREKEEPIRILTAPCSSGEESYTIALSLLQEGMLIQERDFEIIGIDINSEAIQKAQNGVYTSRSVQHIPQDLLNRYFKKKEEAFHITPFLQKAVAFKTLNVMEQSSMMRLGQFDIIFSRNMLIYFDDESRKNVAMTFYKMLKEDGAVFLGHAENMSRIVPHYSTKKSLNSIYFTKDAQ